VERFTLQKNGEVGTGRKPIGGGKRFFWGFSQARGLVDGTTSPDRPPKRTRAKRTLKKKICI